MEHIEDGELALHMLLNLMVELGKVRALTPAQLDMVLNLGIDLLGRTPETSRRRQTLETYRRAWKPPPSRE